VSALNVYVVWWEGGASGASSASSVSSDGRFAVAGPFPERDRRIARAIVEHAGIAVVGPGGPAAGSSDGAGELDAISRASAQREELIERAAERERNSAAGVDPAEAVP